MSVTALLTLHIQKSRINAGRKMVETIKEEEEYLLQVARKAEGATCERNWKGISEVQLR